jgi:catechol 2,3-dioxygenase-like lactoylglutathione lyase family enzyme
MFDHVTIRASDRDASEGFYNTVLEALGIDESYRTRSFSEWQDFSLAQADSGNPPTRRLHVAFVAPSREQVDGFWHAGTKAGYRDDGAPGPRPQYRPDYYGAFLLDPDGNSAEAVHHDKLRRGGVIDHLWIRVADLTASSTFYDTIASFAGLHKRHDGPERVQYASPETRGSFSLVPGPATEHLHIAFPSSDDAVIRSFHAAATGAGYRSNGEPGERPRYHAGYYAAYVLDPDGNNIELVDHHRQ